MQMRRQDFIQVVIGKPERILISLCRGTFVEDNEHDDELV